MAIRVALQHQTRYRYDRPVQLSPQTIRLRPAPHCRTPIYDYTLHVAPENHTLHWQQDPQANFVARCLFPVEATEFTIQVGLQAEMIAINPFDFFLEPSAACYPFAYDADIARELCSYVGADLAGPQFAALLAEIPREPRGTLDFLVDLNKRIASQIGYVTRLEPGIQTTEETVSLRQGSCRDSAWLLVQVARHLGLAARFVSGYLIELAETDTAALHAWAEIYLPGAGWVGFDPTSGLLAAEGHIPLACSAEANRAAPITGMVSACEVQFEYDLTVSRVTD